MESESMMLDVNQVNEMSDEEKSFYYFKLHDSNNDDALDGLELLHAATHHSHANHHATDDNHVDADAEPSNPTDVLNHLIGTLVI